MEQKELKEAKKQLMELVAALTKYLFVLARGCMKGIRREPSENHANKRVSNMCEGVFACVFCAVALGSARFLKALCAAFLARSCLASFARTIRPSTPLFRVATWRALPPEKLCVCFLMQYE